MCASSVLGDGSGLRMRRFHLLGLHAGLTIGNSGLYKRHMPPGGRYWINVIITFALVALFMVIWFAAGDS